MSHNESLIEKATLQWIAELACETSHGPMFAPCEPATERESFTDLLLAGRQREAIRRLPRPCPKSRMQLFSVSYKFGLGGA